MNNNSKSSAQLLAALGLAASLAVVSANAANAAPLTNDANLFQMTEVSSNGNSATDAKCGKGSCGASTESKCGADHKCGKDHKCGTEHKCGTDKDSDSKCGASSCGASK